MSETADAAIPERPRVIVLAGPNGAGKTTTARAALYEVLRVDEFVNADQIALGLAGFAPDSAALEASGLMLQRLRSLAQRRASFAFETTLASRSLAPWIRGLIVDGYDFHLIFVSLLNAEIAIARVRERVRRGGHGIPEDVIRRRFHRGIRNFFELYMPLAIEWRIVDNSSVKLAPVANGRFEAVESIRSLEMWERFRGSETNEGK